LKVETGKLGNGPSNLAATGKLRDRHNRNVFEDALCSGYDGGDSRTVAAATAEGGARLSRGL
jgi:hypothetical protein